MSYVASVNKRLALRVGDVENVHAPEIVSVAVLLGAAFASVEKLELTSALRIVVPAVNVYGILIGIKVSSHSIESGP